MHHQFGRTTELYTKDVTPADVKNGFKLSATRQNMFFPSKKKKSYTDRGNTVAVH